MRKLLFGLLLVTISSFSFSQTKNGYNLEIHIDHLQDSTIYLAYHLGDKQFIRDTALLDKSGHTTFSGTEMLPEGIYMIVLPGKKYFEMLMSDDQHFSLTCTYNNYLKTLKFSGSDENNAFVAYQNIWMSMQKQSAEIALRLKNNKQDKDSVKLLISLREEHERQMKSYLNGVASNNEGSLLGLLVKSLIPVDVPVFAIPPGVRNPDSVRWVSRYLYTKNHFFDNIDITDERLLRTPILYSKLNAFFSNVLIQVPDSLIKEVDKILDKCSINHDIFQFVSVFLFNHFRESEIMGHDAVLVHIADKVYLSGMADWASKQFLDELRLQVELIRPNLIGKKAQDIVMDSYKGIFVSLYDVEKDFTILYFWEPNCGHCAEATPKLKEYYDKAKNDNIEVFAICTTDNHEKWKKYIEEHQLTWINGWDPERKSHFDYYYNVQSTPMVYILDKEKKIIAKKLPVENIGPFIENYKKFLR